MTETNGFRKTNSFHPAEEDLSNSMSPTSHPREPIAIVGMGCRLPGGASSTSKLWDLLKEGRSGHYEMPKSRFNADSFYHPNADHPGTINATGGYFILEDTRCFENVFFGINNLEAKYMDPQQRQLLEVVYECFESAGATLDNLSGANVGCYVANFTTDYLIMQAKDPDSYHRYSATGFGLTILANRISHVFNLKGPSVVLDTACSSSLYALHSACAALNSGECDAAIVAGANLIQSPEMHLAMVKAGVLSGTSMSHTFDASADGYGRGEGVGALYLKRLSSAIQNNDPIRSVVRSTAVNSNGHTPGITLPSVAGQEAVIKKAYTMAGLPFDETTYIEAHGTGTPVGDPVEVEALSRILRLKSGQPTLIGSVKTNLGHSEAVSGISSVIKVTLALENGMIPPTIGIQNINPELKITERNVEVVTELRPWPERTLPRAGINSFGYGGANAHVIIESADLHTSKDYQKPPQDICDNTLILPFSAYSEQSLRDNMTTILSSEINFHNLADLAYTLGCRRSMLLTRGYLLANRSSLDTDLLPSNIRTLALSASPLPIAFVFTGQGAQWPEMGRELLNRFSIYHRAIQDMDSCLAYLPHPPSWTLKEAILASADVSKIHKASYSQPVCTATQIALVELLREWKIAPKAVIGHSSGEICAAYAAGYLTIGEAITIAYYRGLTVSEAPATGAMLAVGLGHETVTALVSDLGLQELISIACVNSPESTTVSGDIAAIDRFLSVLQDQRIFARKLKTDGRAYHSYLMKSVGQRYEDLLSSINPKKSSESAGVEMFSTVTSHLAERDTVSSARYWRNNLESPVLFSDALERLLLSQSYDLIEIGPHPALGQPIKDLKKHLQLGDTTKNYFPTLSRGKDSERSILNLVGSLFLCGHTLPFDKINFPPSMLRDLIKPSKGTRVLHSLPTYRWNYDIPLWTESRMSSEYRTRKHKHHDLLGSEMWGSPGRRVLWRNSLKVHDVPWLQDHRLGQSIVFPGAGYLGMAIEGLRQMQQIDHCVSSVVIFRQVHLINVLVLQDGKDGVEIFMQMDPVKISSVTSSSSWWQFEISSNMGDVSTVHANGHISLSHTSPVMKQKILITEDAMEDQTMKTWYNRLSSEGLCFGPSFKSLTALQTHRKKRKPHAISKTILRRGGTHHHDQQSDYIIHPITIDSLLQTAIIASAAGATSRLHGKIPVSIGRLELMAGCSTDSSDLCTIRAVSEKVGLGTVMLRAELESPTKQILAQLDDVRAIAYAETLQQIDLKAQRNPALRILWKPDISRLSMDHTGVFTEYTDRFASLLPEEFVHSDIGRFVGALDLITHRNPRMHILELENDGTDQLGNLLDLTSIGTSPKRFESYTKASIIDNGDLLGYRCLSNAKAGTEIVEPHVLAPGCIFNIVIVPPSLDGYSTNITLKHLSKYLAPDAILLFTTNSKATMPLEVDQLNVLSTTSQLSETRINIARVDYRDQGNQTISGFKVIFVDNDDMQGFNKALRSYLPRALGDDIEHVSFKDIVPGAISPRSIVITTIELEEPVLARMTDVQLQLIKMMVDNASVLLWITGGGLFKASRPAFSLILGLARSLMLEVPSLKMPVLDLDNISDDYLTSIKNVAYVLNQVIHRAKPDFEYRQHNGFLYNSRFIPDFSINTQFRKAQNSEIESTPIQEAGHCQLAMKDVGHIDTIFFQQQPHGKPRLRPGYVEIQVKAVGLNGKDFYALSNKVDTKNSTCALEFGGIVIRSSSMESTLVPGDRVVVMAPSRFATYECVPEWACCKLRDDEEFVTLSTIPLVFSTALYALEYRASLQPGESVLIHSAAGGLGIAAIQIAQLIGAEIFATVGTPEKKRFLVENFNLKEDCIFSSHNSSFLSSILAMTSNRGVDVVLNSLTGDLLHDSWQACAEDGRFVEVGKKDIIDNGKLDMQVFTRGVTFTAFDLTTLYWSELKSKQAIWHKLLHQSIDMLRNKKIMPVKPIQVFNSSEISQAFRHFSLGTRIGKVAVSFEEPESLLKVVSVKHRTTFDSEKAYLLIGCLGGLGRSLAKWMLQRGARKFVFIGRSGTDKFPAKNLVIDLQEAGATVVIIRGDVTISADVERAIMEAPGPIGGVVHAAMGIHVSLFAEMSCATWHMGINQKVKGAWNLHNGLQDKDSQLDFFLMLSSITGSIGTATESNYCAANAFLDSFASHRRSLGLPATSVGLGMISELGFLHENPEIEAVLLRKGVHPLSEDEFLQIVDLALSPPPPQPIGYIDDDFGADHYGQAHILTGLELYGFQKIREQGFKRPTQVLEDPRCANIAGAFATSSDTDMGGAVEGRGSETLPRAVSAALRSNEDNSVPGEALITAVQVVVVERIGTLLLVPSTQLESETQLAAFGMESMLAAEFRSDMFCAFKVDVAFAVLLDQRTTVRGLADLVARGLLTNKE